MDDAESRGAAENAEKMFSSTVIAHESFHGSGPIASTLDEITGTIIDSAMKIHMDLGPGLLESVYESLLARSLTRRGLIVERQKPVSFEYDGVLFQEGFRADLLVQSQVIVELKSVEKLAPVHSKQLLTYLRLMDLRVGLLLNFGASTLKEGIHRVVNKLPASASPRLRIIQATCSALSAPPREIILPDPNNP